MDNSGTVFTQALGDGNLSYDSDSTHVSHGRNQWQALPRPVARTKDSNHYKERESDQMIPGIHAKKGNKACGLETVSGGHSPGFHGPLRP